MDALLTRQAKIQELAHVAGLAEKKEMSSTMEGMAREPL